MNCTLNGQTVPCDQVPQWFFLLPFLMIPLMLAGLIFWIKMLLDAIKNENENKTLWVVVICLAQFAGAVIYYFAVKRKRTKAINKNK